MFQSCVHFIVEFNVVEVDSAMIFIRLLHVDWVLIEFLLSIHDFDSFPRASIDYQRNSNEFQ